MNSQDQVEKMQQDLEHLRQENAQLREKLKLLELENKNSGQWSDYRLRFLQVFNIISYTCTLAFTPIHFLGAVQEITGYQENDFLQGLTDWEQLIHPEDLSTYKTESQNLLNGHNKPHLMEYRIISGDGQIRWLNDMAVIISDEKGTPTGIEGFILDVTRRQLAEDQSLDREAHLNSILNSVQDVIWSVAPDTFELLYINPAAEKVYGCPLSELYRKPGDGKIPIHPFHEDLLLDNFSTLLQQGWYETDFRIILSDGQTRWLHRRAHFARDAHGGVARIDGIDTDITTRKLAEDTLKYLSHHDSLTGLGNRLSFEEELRQVDKQASTDTGLIICDVDGLKIVNDRLGHTKGDSLLAECAEVLRRCFSETGIIFRIGGDEFTVLIKHTSDQDLAAAANRLRRSIVDYNETCPPLPLSMSIGYAFKSSIDMSMNEIFRQADNLMYAEKPSNHRRFQELFQKFKHEQGDASTAHNLSSLR